MPSCSVSGCAGSGVKTFLFPKINHQSETFQILSEQRRNAWLTALGKTDANPKTWEKLQICDSHFISGKMAALQDVNNMDWVPTMNLRYPKNSNSGILRCSVADCVVSNQGGLCSFYRISKKLAREELKKISDMKLSAWIATLGLRNVVPATCDNIYVCHAHYIIDKSAKLCNTSGSTDSVESFVKVSAPADGEKAALVLSNTNNNILKRLQLRSSNRLKTKVEPLFFKSGDILRSENGKFSFSCGYCSEIKDDCRDMLNHINTHFTEEKQKPVSRLPSPEFVSCTITQDDTVESEHSETLRPLTTAISKPKLPDKGTRSLAKPDPALPRKRRLLPKIDVEGLVASRPCNIKRVKTTDVIDATPTTKSPTLPVKFKPIRIPPLPADLLRKYILPSASHPHGSCFGKNYGMIYKNSNSTDSAPVLLTSSKDLGKANGSCKPMILKCNPQILKCRPEILKCDQCRLEPAVAESDPRQHACINCEEWFPNHMTYRTHFLDTHRYATPRCYQCEMEPPVTNESDPRRHKCAICQDWLPSHAEFRTHLQDTHDEYITDNDFTGFANGYKEFTCYICEKTLKQREYLLFHMKGHFEKYLEYQCHLCGVRVTKESVLREHMKRHDNTPTECDLCNKTFPNILRMRSHRMCHTSELSHICQVCSKGFKLSKYLSSHMAVHNETKLACRYCDATFTWSTGRRAHEKGVHNVI